VVGLAWSGVAGKLYEEAVRLFDDGDYSASLLIACLAIEGFARRGGRDWLLDKLGDLGGEGVLDELAKVREEVLAGVRDAGEGEARFALDVLGRLLGREAPGEVVVTVDLGVLGLILALIGLIASFVLVNVDLLPLWFDALRIPVLALVVVTLLDRLLM